MGRPITLFTGQWADLPLETLAQKSARGVRWPQTPCWVDHFEVNKALESDAYVRRTRSAGEVQPKSFAISNHLVRQCVFDNIDRLHTIVLSPRLWGDGDPEGVRRRCAEEMKNTAKAAKLFGVDIVNGFTGSSVWGMFYFFPPTSQADIDAGYADFAARWTPIFDVFQAEGVKFGLEVHPTEIAYDLVTFERALKALYGHPSFGINFDPSHLIHQFIDPPELIYAFPDRIIHAHVKDFTAAPRRAQQHPLLTFSISATDGAGGTSSRRATGTCAGIRSSARSKPHRLSRPALHRVGRQRHGPRVRRTGVAGDDPQAGLAPSAVAFDAAFGSE